MPQRRILLQTVLEARSAVVWCLSSLSGDDVCQECLRRDVGVQPLLQTPESSVLWLPTTQTHSATSSVQDDQPKLLLRDALPTHLPRLRAWEIPDAHY